MTGHEALAASRRGAAARAVAHSHMVSPDVRRPRVEPTAISMNTAGEGLRAARRAAIYYVNALFGFPPEEVWRGQGGLISEICKRLEISAKSRDHVEKVLEDIKDAREAGEVYDGAAPEHVGGRRYAILEGSKVANKICNAVSAGIGMTQATLRVNLYLESKGSDRVSYSAVRNYVERSYVLYLHKRATKKSGSTDEGSKWARARLNQCIQLLKQFRLGEKTKASARTRGRTRDADNFPPLHVDGVAYWDETHYKIRLGFGGKWEYLVCRDPDTGLPCREEDGGVWDLEKPSTNVKYAGECRLLCGVAAVTTGGGAGKLEGRKAEPYSYTNWKVVGVKTYRALRVRELGRAKGLVGHPWSKVKNGPGEPKGSGGYEALYPDTWSEEVDKALRRGAGAVVCVTELMDHVVAESKKLFRGTTHEHDFVIWHDALSAWWEDEAQDYLATLGFKDRQVCALDDTNAEFARYSHGLVGDSPELMPLDAHLFSDLSQELWRHVAITSNLPESDPRRFSTGTPAEMERSVVRAWQVAPTPDRIVEDCTAIPKRIERIIEAKGVAVQDIYFRSGRRYRAANDARDLEHKPRKRQRKATCTEAKPVHPDAQSSWDALCASDSD